MARGAKRAAVTAAPLPAKCRRRGSQSLTQADAGADTEAASEAEAEEAMETNGDAEEEGRTEVAVEVVSETEGANNEMNTQHPRYWFDPAMAGRLWMPDPTTLHDAPSDGERDPVVTPLLQSWFSAFNYTNTNTGSSWRPPQLPRAQLTPAKRSPRTNKISANSTTKLRLFPTTEQRLKLERMFGTHRAIYNKLVARSRDECEPHYCEERDKYVVATLQELKSKYNRITRARNLHEFFRRKKSRDRHGAVYEEVRDAAFRDFVKAIKSSRALYRSLKEKNKNTTYPVIGFKSKFALSDTIELRARSTKAIPDTDRQRGQRVQFHAKFFRFKRGDGIAISEPLPPLNYSVKLQRLREGDYYLVVPLLKEWEPSTATRVCAIDPGVVNFVTVYDPEGRTVSVSDRSALIKRRFDAIDQMKSTLDLMSNECKERHAESVRSKHCTGRPHGHDPDQLRARRRRYRLRRRIRYANRRVTRMTADMHHKVASWLAANYRCVLLPLFQTSEMVLKYEEDARQDGAPAVDPHEFVLQHDPPAQALMGEHEVTNPVANGAVNNAPAETGVGGPHRRRRNRRIHSSTARAMLSQAHYRFRMVLKHKLERVGGVLVECDEAYTSKTCSMCGHINDTLGGDRVLRCRGCGGRFDRDVNAARNILMKNWQLLQ